MTTLDAAQALQHCAPKAIRLGICDLPDDVLILVFFSLHGEDVARCIPVCRRFSDLIHGDLSLQYSIELAVNGMVDGDHSLTTLPVSERMQRLRQYSSDFSSGAFYRQDLTAHPDYLRQDHDLLGWPRRVIHLYPRPSGAIYMDVDRADSALYLSHFVPGSAQCGIPSSRSWFSVRDGVRPDLALKGWTVDDAQDLFVTVKETQMLMPPVVDGVPDIYIHFYALSDLEADATVLTPHPAAALPLIRLPTLDSTTPKNGSWPRIVGPYVMVGIVAETGAKQWFHFVDVYNWKSGEMVSRTNIGNVHASVIPLDERYLLVFPSMGMPEPQPNLRIYTFVPSPSCHSSRARAGRHVCTLELPPTLPGEHAVWSQAKSGDRRSEESTGHFRTDAARSVIALYIQYQGVDSERGNEEEEDGGEGDEDEGEDEDEDGPTGTPYTYATHVLIPRATLSAQIQAAESASNSRHRQMRGEAGSGSDEMDTANELTVTVPWADWGPRGSLRLYRRGALYDGQHVVVPAPFGSRFPFVVSASDPDSRNDLEHVQAESAAGAGSVYVFDVNPLVARSALRSPRDRGAMTAVVDAGDIEKVLPGVVDPECSAIPYVVYRFPLPYPDPPSTEAAPGLPVAPPAIRAVTMSMAGFTVQFDDSVEYEKGFQTCTV